MYDPVINGVSLMCYSIPAAMNAVISCCVY